MAALGAVGAEVYSFGQYSQNPILGTPATYIFAFSGVGGSVVVPPPAVPEPETYAMMLAGLGLIGFSARRKKQA